MASVSFRRAILPSIAPDSHAFWLEREAVSEWVDNCGVPPMKTLHPNAWMLPVRKQAKKYCTLARFFPKSRRKSQAKSPWKSRNILTMSGTASRAKKRSNSNVLQYPAYILKDIYQTKDKGLHYTTPGFLSKMAQKRQKTAIFRQKNTGLLRGKHPHFWGKTSELCPKEVRCFCISGPKTPRKHAKRGLKA